MQQHVRELCSPRLVVEDELRRYDDRHLAPPGHDEVPEALRTDEGQHLVRVQWRVPRMDQHNVIVTGCAAGLIVPG